MDGPNVKGDIFMTTGIKSSPSLSRSLVVYTSALVAAALVAVGIIWALNRFTALNYPVGILYLIMPMIAAMQAGTDFARHSGAPAGFGHAIKAGLLMTLVVVVGVLALWQAGMLDAMLRYVDPYAFDNGMIGRMLAPILIVVGGFGLFCNVVMFWSAARGEVRRQERRAAKEAGKVN